MFLKGAIRSGTKGRRAAIFATTIVAIISVPAIMYSFGANPPLGNTGAPGEGTCASCHGNLAGSSGVTVNAPASYTPGGPAVNMTVSVPGGRGFELAIETQSGNAQAGTLAAGPQDGVSTVGAIQYVFSTVETTSWTFAWTPPATNVGNVVVYVTGGTNGTSYANTAVIAPAVTTPPTPTLSALPTSLSFTVNGAEPADQTISVASSGSAVAVTASSATTPAGGSWLTIMPPGGNTPLSETVHIVATGLTAGTYNGSVSFASTGASNSPVSVPVTLTVTTPIPPTVTPPTLDLSSAGLNFTATVGGTASPQSVMVTTSNGSVATFNVAPTSTGNWLTVGGSTGTSTANTPVSESVGVVMTGLAAGTYHGSLTFTSSAVSNTQVTLPVTLTVNSSTPPPTGLPWSFNTNVVDRQAGGTDYMLITGNGGMNSTNQLSGSGSFTRFQSLTASTTSTSGRGTSAAPTSSTHPVVANGRWRVTGLTSSKLTTSTTTNSSGVTTTRVSGGTATLAVSVTISGCNSGGEGGGGGDDGAPAPTASPITGSLTVTSTGSSGSGISLTYQGTCISTSSTGTTTSTPISGSFTSVGVGTYSLGGGGGDN